MDCLGCSNCGKGIDRVPSKLKATRHGFYFCSRKCKEKSQRLNGNCSEIQPSHYGILYYVKDLKKSKYYEIRYPHKRCRKCGYLLKDYGGKKASLHPFGPLVADVWTDIHRIKHNKYRDEHPCQLPVHLLERIILMSTDKNDIVLDPFVGTGTTVIAAKRLGRRFIGIDMDEKYVNTTKDKLSRELPNSKISDIWVSFYLDEIATIRDIDWEKLSKYFLIPTNIKDIDFTKIKFDKHAKLFVYEKDKVLSTTDKNTKCKIHQNNY